MHRIPGTIVSRVVAYNNYVQDLNLIFVIIVASANYNQLIISIGDCTLFPSIGMLSLKMIPP